MNVRHPNHDYSLAHIDTLAYAVIILLNEKPTDQQNTTNLPRLRQIITDFKTPRGITSVHTRNHRTFCCTFHRFRRSHEVD